MEFLPLSVAIITHNEEKKLPKCLASLPVGAEVVVVDSESTDRTRAVAEEYGARCIVRPFTDYADQKNYAVSVCSRKWVLSLDADECLSHALSSKIVEVVLEASQVGYRLPRRLRFMGKTLKYGKTADAPTRLFQQNVGRFEGAIHEKVVLPSPARKLSGAGYLIHDSYDDLTDYFARFNRYTSLVAQNHYRNHRKLPALLPMRVLWEFFSRYFLRLGFLDGYPGFCFALISSLYSFIKYVKLQELYGHYGQQAPDPIGVKR